jgi:hypothetical protein
MKKTLTKSQQGKKNKRDGAKFELLVRKYLESKGWIVSKWMNNVEFPDIVRIPATENTSIEAFDKKRFNEGRLSPAKHKFCGIGRPMALGTGFPDFICFKRTTDNQDYDVIGVEVKSNGYLDKEEKIKCKWLMKNKIFNYIWIAKKGEDKEEILFSTFKDE